MNWVSIRNPLSLEEIENVEKDLKIMLPSDYKELIGAINGGALKNACVTCEYGEIPYSRNVSLSPTAKSNIYQLFGCVMGSEQYFPFASVGNGDYFCFDLKKKKVVLWEHEMENIVSICETFTDLLEMISQ